MEIANLIKCVSYLRIPHRDIYAPAFQRAQFGITRRMVRLVNKWGLTPICIFEQLPMSAFGHKAEMESSRTIPKITICNLSKPLLSKGFSELPCSAVRENSLFLTNGTWAQ